VGAEGDKMSEQSQWYVVHTYSGYENKVKANIEKIIENRNMQDQIHQVVVPVHDSVEVKNGQKKNRAAENIPRLCPAQNVYERRHMVCRAQYPGRDQLCRAGLEAGAPFRSRSSRHGH